MDIVLSRSGGVSVRDQIKAQLELKILGGDFKAGQRLPSVRALARRLKVHANTVSAAYQQLQDAGHLELKPGSGVFVRSSGPKAPHEARDLDEMIRLALHMALERYSGNDVRAAVVRWLHGTPPDRIVAIDGHQVDLPPARYMLVVHNDDTPGVIGRVGTVLGDAKVNIANMDVGQSPSGEAALMVIATEVPVPSDVVEKVTNQTGVQSARAIDLG